MTRRAKQIVSGLLTPLYPDILFGLLVGTVAARIAQLASLMPEISGRGWYNTARDADLRTDLRDLYGLPTVYHLRGGAWGRTHRKVRPQALPCLSRDDELEVCFSREAHRARQAPGLGPEEVYCLKLPPRPLLPYLPAQVLHNRQLLG